MNNQLGNNRNDNERNQQIAAALLVLVLIFFGFGPMLSDLLLARRMASENTTTAAEETITEPEEEKQEAPEQPATFPAADFTVTRLVLKYQYGTWDGELVKSTDGKHVASIGIDGRLWLDGQETSTYPDLPEGANFLKYRSLYRDETGTYVCDFDNFRTTDNIVTKYLKGEPGQQYTLPTDLEASKFFIYPTYLENVVIMDSYNGEIIRFDPRADDNAKFELISEAAPVRELAKVSATSVRFVVRTADENQVAVDRLIEIRETGEPEELCRSTHPLTVRALLDYPEQGDYDEFWFLRLAYQSGHWDGKTASIRQILESFPSTGRKNAEESYQNRRQPTYDDLVLENLDPSKVACIYGSEITLDNVPTYYLHATAPYLVNDVKYAKAKSMGIHGFAEIDLAALPTFYSWRSDPIQQSPVCRISYAATADDVVRNPAQDLTSGVISLPYYDRYGRERLDKPVNFLENLELLDAINYDNGLRALLIGCYSTEDVTDPEQCCRLYISRHNSLFEEIADNVVTANFWSEFNNDSVSGNYDAPTYDRAGLFIYGRERAAEISDIFTFNNAMKFYSYSTDLNPIVDADFDD